MRKPFQPRWFRPTLFSLEDRVNPSGAQDITGLTALRADPAFDDIDGALTGESQNVGIAVLDSGLFGNHPDLRGNVVAFYDAVSNADTRGPVIQDPSQLTPANDPDGHGSHVAGTAASTNPEIGVAVGADLIAVRTLPAEGERIAHDSLANALAWTVQNQQRFNIRVVNMSLGTPSNVNDLSQVRGVQQLMVYARLIDELESLGVTVVVSSGNSYGQHRALGASVPAVFATVSVANTWEDDGVGDQFPDGGGGPGDRFIGVDRDGQGDRLTASSQRSSLPNQVAAPGQSIFSTYNGAVGADGQPKLFNTMAGTSMASPFVAGVVALMQDAAMTYGGRYLSPEDVIRILRESADTITDAPTDRNFVFDAQTREQGDLPETGEQFARVNALKAVRQVREEFGSPNQGPDPDPDPDPDPPPGSGADTNNTLARAAAVPALDGNRVYTFNGRIGQDGMTPVGASDVDLFKVTARSPGTLLAVTVQPNGGQAFDSFVRIFDADGQELAANDDFGDSTYGAAGIEIGPGTYYIGVSSFANDSYRPTDGSGAVDGESTGDYLLGVQLNNPDPNGVFTGAASLDSGEFIRPYLDPARGRVGLLSTGTLGSDPPPMDGSSTERVIVGPGDVDMYRYVAADDGLLFVRASSAAELANPFGAPLGPPPFNPFDTYLRVFDADGREIAADDDFGPATDSALTVSVTRGQVLFLAVSNFANSGYDPANPTGRPSSGDGGYYELFAQLDNGDLNGTAFDAVPDYELGTPAAGTVGTDFLGPTIGADGSRDVDFVGFVAPDTKLLRLSVTGLDGFNPSVSLWGFRRDAAGNVIELTRFATSDKDDPTLLARIDAGETYFFSVTGRGNTGFSFFQVATGSGGETGSYEVTTELRSLSEVDGVQDKGVRDGAPPPILTLGVPQSGDLGRDVGADGSEFVVSAAGADGLTVYGRGDIDTYTFVPTKSGRVAFLAQASTLLGSTGDPVLRVFDADGNELGMNDDLGPNTRDAEVVLEVVAGRTYYVGVTGFGESATAYSILDGSGLAASAAGQTGPYTLVVTDRSTSPPPVSPPPVSPPPVSPPPVSPPPVSPPPVSPPPVSPPPVSPPPVSPPPPLPPPPPPPPSALRVGFPQFAAGADFGGTVTFYNPDGSPRFTFDPFPGFAGGIRTAAADFTGDGIADLIVGTGPGGASRVQVIDGATRAVLFDFAPFEATFLGGVFVAAGDINGDGRPDLIVTPDEGGGPRVDVFTGNGFGRIGSFFAFQDDPNFRGGARAAAGDVNADGVADLVVSAGFGGGPRIATFDGRAVAGGSPNPNRLLADFFAFEPVLRNGAYVAVGDLDGDGRADLLFGGGPGGGPRVLAFSGAALLDGNRQVPLANFFGGDPGNRGGVRVSVKNLDGDARADLVIGAGTGAVGRVTGYRGSSFVPIGEPPVAFDFTAPGAANGVFVG